MLFAKPSLAHRKTVQIEQIMHIWPAKGANRQNRSRIDLPLRKS